MANYSIKNDQLEVVIRSLGAEIISMKDKEGNIEYLGEAYSLKEIKFNEH